jgi:Resolvase, N terminal domain
VLRVAAFCLPIVALEPVMASAAATKAGNPRVVCSARFADRGDWSLVYPSSARPARLASQDELPARDSSADHGQQHGSDAGVLIGYARCSTDKQDLEAQCHTLRGLGVSDDRVSLDHGMTGRNRKQRALIDRPPHATSDR